jgi:iron complex outermembrane recepter protein
MVFSLLLVFFASAAAANAPAKKQFNLQPGLAAASLKDFIAQSGVQLLYVAEEVSGVTTNAVKGEYTPREAVRQLLANTVLAAVETENGAIAIKRAPGPNGSRVARDSERDHPEPRAETDLPRQFPAR